MTLRFAEWRTSVGDGSARCSSRLSGRQSNELISVVTQAFLHPRTLEVLSAGGIAIDFQRILHFISSGWVHPPFCLRLGNIVDGGGREVEILDICLNCDSTGSLSDVR